MLTPQITFLIIGVGQCGRRAGEIVGGAQIRGEYYHREISENKNLKGQSSEHAHFIYVLLLNHQRRLTDAPQSRGFPSYVQHVDHHGDSVGHPMQLLS